MNVPTLPTFATSEKLTGTVTTSPAVPVAVPIFTLSATTGPSVIDTLPSLKLTVDILAMLPSPKAPPSLNLTVVVTFLVPNTLNLMFANTPSAVISSSPIVLSRNTKLILPFAASILVEKLTAGFTTILPASTDTASSCVLSYPT